MWWVASFVLWCISVVLCIIGAIVALVSNDTWFMNLCRNIMIVFLAAMVICLLLHI